MDIAEQREGTRRQGIEFVSRLCRIWPVNSRPDGEMLSVFSAFAFICFCSISSAVIVIIGGNVFGGVNSIALGLVHEDITSDTTGGER